MFKCYPELEFRKELGVGFYKHCKNCIGSTPVQPTPNLPRNVPLALPGIQDIFSYPEFTKQDSYFPDFFKKQEHFSEICYYV